MSLLNLLRLSLTLFVALLCAVPSPAAGKKDTHDFDPFTAGIEENIKTPAVPEKLNERVAAAMTKLQNTLANAGYKVEKVRDGEVVMVTIEASKLFGANSTELREKASSVLMPLVPYVRRTDNYKVVLAVHSDDTGDVRYADSLTADRASAIDGFITSKTGGGESGIIPYGLGFDEPVAPNSGIRNRAANRRVEFYFIPTAEFISKVKK